MNDFVHIVRIACGEDTARRLADRLVESGVFPDAAISAFERSAEDWLVELYLPRPPDRDDVTRAIAAIDAASAQAITFEELPARDWVAESLAGLKPVQAGPFVVHGAHDRARIPRHCIALEIEASLAFGTGHHGTTRGCLLALAQIVKRSGPRPGPRRVPRVLDVGTGTGVLAMAAAKALRADALASDIDAVAARVARENVRLNGVGNNVRVVRAAGVGQREIRVRAPYDLVFANILLSPLRRLATPLVGVMRAGGRVVLSGLLKDQAAAAISAYRSHGLSLESRIELEGWTTLTMRRGRAR